MYIYIYNIYIIYIYIHKYTYTYTKVVTKKELNKLISYNCKPMKYFKMFPNVFFNNEMIQISKKFKKRRSGFSLAKWLSVRLRTKWVWVPIPLLSLKLQILHLFRAKSSLTFRQL